MARKTLLQLVLMISWTSCTSHVFNSTVTIYYAIVHIPRGIQVLCIIITHYIMEIDSEMQLLSDSDSFDINSSGEDSDDSSSSYKSDDDAQNDSKNDTAVSMY